ncbi:hypothetical protein B0H13DRAFT_2361202 [Mycena leptocephala]|nr:hypothetical protein B0H13DRAFT_2361202 [Mycena leptocephala]
MSIPRSPRIHRRRALCQGRLAFHYSQCLDCEEQETNNTVNSNHPLDLYVSSCADAGFPVKNVTVENAFNGGAGQMGPRGFGVVALLAGVLGTGLLRPSQYSESPSNLR